MSYLLIANGAKPLPLEELQQRSDMSVFICLMNEIEKMGWLFKDRFRHDTKQAVENFLKAGIEVARKQNEGKFLQLMQLIRAFHSGELQIIENSSNQI